MKEALMIKRLIAQDEEAFDYCYEQYKNLVYFKIFSILKNKETSEELVQDTFLKMYNSINTFDGQYFKAWLLTIATNLAISEIRKTKETIEYDDNILSKEVMSEFAYNDLLMDLSTILSDEEYKIVIYRTVYDLKIREVAEIFNQPTGTISYKYSEAIKKAKKHLNGVRE